MKLPNVDQAEISAEKLTGYLLSATHRDGKHKAAFFTRFGFKPEAYQQLKQALLEHAHRHDVVKQEPSPFGIRFVVEGPMPAPNGRAPNVRTVWFVETGHGTPRFVTAYPLRGENDD